VHAERTRSLARSCICQARTLTSLLRGKADCLPLHAWNRAHGLLRVATMSRALRNQPTLVESGKLRFFIMDAPTQDTIRHYLACMQGYKVGAWVRCCEEATYAEDTIRDLGIQLYDFSFPDGEAPPQALINRWLDLCFASEHAIAVHCVAGLGRAPLLVALALIESGQDCMDAVEIIRKHRRGAINRLQLQYVQQYKPTRRKAPSCVVM